MRYREQFLTTVSYSYLPPSREDWMMRERVFEHLERAHYRADTQCLQYNFDLTLSLHIGLDSTESKSITGDYTSSVC